MISNALTNFAKYSRTVADIGDELRNNSVQDNGTWGQDLSARALYIVQMVISIVSIPLLFLGMLFGSAFALCTEGKEAAYELLKNALILPLRHLATISGSLMVALNLQEIGLKLRADSLKDGGTWGQALTARALFLVQAVTAIVIAPLTSLAMLFLAAASFCENNKKQAYQCLKRAVVFPPVILATIPTNLISAFVPHSLEWETPASQLGKCAHKCAE